MNTYYVVSIISGPRDCVPSYDSNKAFCIETPQDKFIAIYWNQKDAEVRAKNEARENPGTRVYVWEAIARFTVDEQPVTVVRQNLSV